MKETGNTPLIIEDDRRIRDRVLHLFTFLRELTELRTKTVQSLAQYEKVLWLNEIPREPGCYCAAWRPVKDEESEVWIEVNKPTLKSPPEIPEPLRSWLDPQGVWNSSLEFPSLLERISLNTPGEEQGDESRESQTVFRELSEEPEIKAAWEQYVKKRWLPWAEVDRRQQVIQKVYTELFSIYQKQQRLGEAYEILIGLGCLVWKNPGGNEVKRHLLTAQCNLMFDAARGVIAIGPAGEGAKPSLEQDMLEPQERPDPVEQNAIEQQIAAIGDSLWDGVQVQTALKGWIHAMSPRGQFDETLVPPTGIGSDPKVYLAPAIILRKRTERSLLRVFQEIIEQLHAGQPVPIGVRRLVEITDDASGPAEDNSTENRPTDVALTPGEIYFPLPANEEQRKIAQKLAVRQGVLVQGPPGTGKSHTIANLVCHLLAMGQRVLVTSHATRALNVLRDMLPKEIADLCVVLLGDDLEAMESLENSVRGITDRYNAWDPQRNRELVAELEKRLDETRRAEASTLKELRTIREAETYQHILPFGNYKGTAQAIARRLKEEEPNYSWLPACPGEEDPPPLIDTEAAKLVRLLRDIDHAREEEVEKIAIDPDALISPEEFSEKVRREREACTRHQAANSQRNHPSYSVLVTIPREKREALIDKCSALRAAYEGIVRHIQPWIREAAVQVLTDRDRAWRELLAVTKEHLEAIKDRARPAWERRISGLSERDRSIVRADAVVLLKHLESGGRLGVGPFRPKVVKQSIYLIHEVYVDGQPCRKPGPIRDLLQWIEVTDRLEALGAYWQRCIEPTTGSYSAQIAEYQDLCEPLEKILGLHDRVRELREICTLIPGLVEPQWHDQVEVQALQDALEAVTLEEDFEEAQKSFGLLEANLSSTATNPNAHPAIEQALEAVRERDERQYGRAYQTLSDVRRWGEELRNRRDLLEKLAVVPKLTSELQVTYLDKVWDERTGSFTSAWNWARANGWLRRVSDPKAQERLLRELDWHQNHIRQLLCELAEAKAWGYCFSRLTEHERQHLMAWTKAVRRVGKGTGKYASLHRRSAREHMEQCRSAIPAWIMPIYRVAETVRPGVDAFDVVIVDEASQAGPEALFLQYLAKKIIVVGDDKQISPYFVGLTREDVDQLRRRHILDVPHNDSLGVDNSFFDQAEIRYGGRIRLREHFRCMPEIIQFSNELCYRSEPLVPLRQYGAGRLPPIVACHISNGYEQGYSPNIINRPEAEAIVEQIRKLCQDPRYDGKSMGVISLLGEEQARLIERLLLEKIGPEEMENRRLVCGDAYAFQGDERHVIFLSLVSAPGEGRRIGTLASQRDERRFNVAASRAKDQMWLFYSATLNDLSPRCLRYRLLEYCLNPRVQPTTSEGIDLETIRMFARTSDRDRNTPPAPFGSWFEVDVFLKIAERDYRVIPQFECAGCRIDLVVEGMEGRVGVECDGDSWHGADRYEEDAARERMLRRCGWTFWRIRGGVFYRDPEAALESLWGMLNHLKIYPTAQEVQSMEIDKQATRGEVGGYNREQIREPVSKKPSLIPIQRETGRSSMGSDDTAATAVLEKASPQTRQVNQDLFVRQGAQIPLASYQTWKPRPLPDPRVAPLDEVIPGLIDIVTMEGPMLCHRAYRVYARAAGIGRVKSHVRAAFNRAMHRAIRQGLIEQRNEHGTSGQINQVVRKAGVPAVLVRIRGDRTFEEIPPAELGAAMNQVFSLDPSLGEEELFRSVLDLYQIGRLTTNIRSLLGQIKARYLGKSEGDLQ